MRIPDAEHAAPRPLVVFDILSLIRARGHHDGILRVVRSLAHYARTQRPDIRFAMYDGETGAFRAVRDRWLDLVLDGARIDVSHIADPFATKRRLRERLPPRLRKLALVVQRPRRQAFLLTERWRLEADRPSRTLQWLQSRLMSDKYRRELTDAEGRRRDLVPFDMAIGDELDLTRDDVVIFTGSDWAEMARVAQRKATTGAPRLVVLCHDIIPLMFPSFFRDGDIAKFRACFHALFPVADLTVLTTHRVTTDVRTYCETHAIALGETAVVPLGADLDPAMPPGRADRLPHGLRPRGYALFVSTIEPRKNHALLLAVWKRLLAAGVPQAHDMKLVFVGRKGWLVAELLKAIDDEHGDGRIVLLSDVDDTSLQTIYAHAAFCVYPSLYEGFGLPIIEGFRRGKAVIASNRGALPEVVDAFSLCLDPEDEDIWTATMMRWLSDPATYADFETKIRDSWTPRSWDMAGAEFFATVDRAATRWGNAR